VTGALLDAVVRRDRAVTLAGVAAVAVLAWAWLVRLGRELAAMADMHMGPWTIVDAALAAVMWAVMMVAMMLPAAAPMILAFTAVHRRRAAAGAGGAPHVSVWLFVTGYLAVWTGFSVAAAAAQWGLHAAALLSPDAMRAAPLVGAAFLAAAGIWQLTPLKYACLAQCRTPLGFLLREWREGRRGALVMGLRHGGYCLGCCWVLMALLFVGGLMNLVWVAALAGFVLLEKVLPAGRLTSWASGAALLLWAAWTLAQRG